MRELKEHMVHCLDVFAVLTQGNWHSKNDIHLLKICANFHVYLKYIYDILKNDMDRFMKNEWLGSVKKRDKEAGPA
ncbi:hypothetical protein ACO0LG_04365 [Undibacterium sp. Ji42W]|uniref:hypothetical protein n=1 Tax=Undibacterium sp. Ji42W TaxID=3413039 RepID=UPI003BF408EC